MSQGNVEVVREMYEDFQRGGWDAVLAHLPSEFEWEADPRHPGAGIYRGLDAYRDFLRELEEPFERTDVETERFFASGDQVLAFLKVRRWPRGSSSAMEIKVATLWTLQGGKPVRGRFFANRGEGRKALSRSGRDAHADP